MTGLEKKRPPRFLTSLLQKIPTTIYLQTLLRLASYIILVLWTLHDSLSFSSLLYKENFLDGHVRGIKVLKFT